MTSTNEESFEKDDAVPVSDYAERLRATEDAILKLTFMIEQNLATQKRHEEQMTRQHEDHRKEMAIQLERHDLLMNRPRPWGAITAGTLAVGGVLWALFNGAYFAPIKTELLNIKNLQSVLLEKVSENGEKARSAVLSTDSMQAMLEQLSEKEEKRSVWERQWDINQAAEKLIEDARRKAAK